MKIAQNRPQQSKLSQYLSKGDVPNIFLRTVATNGAFDLPGFFSLECADFGDDLDVLLLLALCSFNESGTSCASSFFLYVVDVEPTNDVVVCIDEGSSRVVFFGLFLRCCVVFECIFTLYILLYSKRSEIHKELFTVGINYQPIEIYRTNLDSFEERF